LRYFVALNAVLSSHADVNVLELYGNTAVANGYFVAPQQQNVGIVVGLATQAFAQATTLNYPS
jgi:hypothetical protein